MAIQTYGELKQAVALWLNRLDLGDNGALITSPTGVSPAYSSTLIENFIALAERKIFRRLKSPANEKIGLPRLTIETNRVTVPNDLLEIKSVSVGGVIYEYMPSFTWRQKYPKAPLIAYLNQFKFTRELNYLYFPTTITACGKDDEDNDVFPEIKIYYYADLSGMNDDDEKNEVLRIAPDLYLFGALLEAEGYIVNDGRIQVWQAKFDEAYAHLMDYSHQMDYGAGPLVMEF